MNEKLRGESEIEKNKYDKIYLKHAHFQTKLLR